MLHEMIITISKGQQITIPAEWRKDLGLDIGSKIEVIKEDTRLIIQPAGEDLKKLFEEAKKIKPKLGLTAKKMDRLVENEIHR